MKCKKCNSENLTLVLSGPHQKLVCADCLTFQKFLSVAEAKKIKENKDLFSYSKGKGGDSC